MASKSVAPPSCSGREPINLANARAGPPDANIQRIGSSQQAQQAQQQHTGFEQQHTDFEQQHTDFEQQYTDFEQQYTDFQQQAEKHGEQQHQQHCTSQHAKPSTLSRPTSRPKTKLEHTFNLSAALACAHNIIDIHKAEATVLQDRIRSYKRANGKLQRELDELRGRERIREQADQTQALQDRIIELEAKVKGLEGSVDALGG
ncbi:hypothetical protein UCRNP2_10001 [Neofusicoccum parvum UCRNP2]|uniref:Uncharacterized protein n=1 Tax=Botryosphaeria parva (strain UCR-NP2) TaxID=1287680 RepID=R1FW16_BOTPV|nr:hypothetical protein UCRNP2_10001 [Neofusicoccum parvum UCRNP2]